MKPCREAIERGALALHGLDGLNPWYKTSDETKDGFRSRAVAVIMAAISPGELLEEDAGSPEHPVGLVYLDREPGD